LNLTNPTLSRKEKQLTSLDFGSDPSQLGSVFVSWHPEGQ